MPPTLVWEGRATTTTVGPGSGCRGWGGRGERPYQMVSLPVSPSVCTCVSYCVYNVSQCVYMCLSVYQCVSIVPQCLSSHLMCVHPLSPFSFSPSLLFSSLLLSFSPCLLVSILLSFSGTTISNTEGSHVGRAWCFTKEGPLWEYCDTDGDLYVRLGGSDSDFDSAENCSGERRRDEEMKRRREEKMKKQKRERKALILHLVVGV